jgi:hypothetical protein
MLLFQHFPKVMFYFDTGCHPTIQNDAQARWGNMAKGDVAYWKS